MEGIPSSDIKISSLEFTVTESSISDVSFDSISEWMKYVQIHSVNHRSFLAPLQKKRNEKQNKQKKAHHHHHQKHKNSSDLNCPFGLTGGHVFLNSLISSSIVVRRLPRERKVLGSNPACAGIFWGSSHTSDFKIGTPVATLPGA